MSATVERRRELLEEVLAARSAAVAQLPALEDEPPADDPRWVLGLLRVVMTGAARRRRTGARNAAVVALAWLEAFDVASEPPVANPGKPAGSGNE